MANKKAIMDDLLNYAYQNNLSKQEVGDMAIKSNVFGANDYVAISDSYDSMKIAFNDTPQNEETSFTNYTPKNFSEAKQLQEYKEQKANETEQKAGLVSDLQTKSKALEDLTKSDGLSGAVGSNFIGRMSPSSVFTGEKQKFLGDVEMITNQETMDKLLNLKKAGGTLGALSDSEKDMLRDAATKINNWAVKDKQGKVTGYDISEDAFKEEVNRLKSLTDKAIAESGGVTTQTGETTQGTMQTGMEMQPVAPTQLAPEQAKVKILDAYKEAKQNPGDQEAQEFIKHFQEGHFDITTGRLKDEFRPKSEEEQEFEKIYGATTGTTQTGVKGIMAEAGGDTVDFLKDSVSNVVDTAKNVYGSVKETGKEMVGIASKNDEEKIKRFEELDIKQQDLNKRVKEIVDNKAIPQEEKDKIKKGLIDENNQLQKEREKIESGEYDQSLASTALQEVGAIASGGSSVVGDILLGGMKQVGDTAKFSGKLALSQETEDYIDTKTKETLDKAYGTIVNSEFGRDAIKAMQEGGEKWEKFQTEQPELSSNLKAVAQVVEGITTIAGIGVGKKAVVKGAEKLATTGEKVIAGVGEKAVSLGRKTGEVLSGVGGKVKGVFKAGEKSIPEGTILEGQKGAEFLDKLKPKLTPTQNKKLTREGKFFKEEKGKIKGFLEGKGKDVYSYSKYDKDVANSVADALGGVAKAEKMDKNEIVRNLRDRIKVTSETLKPELEKVSIDPKKMGNIKGEWKIIKQTQANDPNFLSSNGKKLHKDFETFIDKVGVIKGNKLQSADELWNLAKKYDDLYPNIANYSGTDPKILLQKEMWSENRDILRNTINKAVENSNATKETKEAFKKMSHYYRAIDNLGTQTLEKGTKGAKGQIKESIKGKVITGAVSLAGAGYVGSKF